MDTIKTTKQMVAGIRDMEPPCVDCMFFKWDRSHQRCANWETRICHMHVLQVYSFILDDNLTGVYH